MQAIPNGRLRRGVGSGSTRDDFEPLGYDYDHRFRTFKNGLWVAEDGDTIVGFAFSWMTEKF